MRIFAIFLVVLDHIAQQIGIPYIGHYLGGFYGLPNFYFTSIGGIGVTLFLIVSGCVLAYNYGGLSSMKELKQFYITRVIRLYPPYWCAIIITLALYLLLIPGYAGIISLNSLILTFGGVYFFLGQWGGPILATGWFVGLILSLYLLYPIINYMFNKNIIYAILLLFVVSIVSRVICGQLQSSGVGFRLIDWVPLCRLFEFGLGIYLVKSNLYLKTINVSPDRTRSVIFLSEISYPVYLIHTVFIDSQLQSALRYYSDNFQFNLGFFKIICGLCLVIACVFAVLIIYYVDSNIQRFLRHKNNPFLTVSRTR